MSSDVWVHPIMKSENGSLLSTNSYVTVKSFKIRSLKSKTIIMTAVTNNLLFKIDYSMDGSTWITRLTDIAVNVGAYVVRETESNAELRGFWNFCRIQLKAAVADVHGTGTFWFESGTL